MTKTSHRSIANSQTPKCQGRRLCLIGLIVLLSVFGSMSAIGEERTLEIDVAGVTRSAVVVVPDDTRINDQLPLVLAFHGSSWNGRVMQQTTGFSELAEQEKFIVAYPNGSGPSNILSWNAEFCCSFALERNVDDLSFVDLLLDKLIASYPVDPSRVYATGFSNGGMFAYMLAIERPEQFAAIAVVSGAMYATQQPSNIAVPMLIIHGTDDSVIPYSGGWGALRTLSGKTEPAVSAVDAASFWIANNGCPSSEPVISRERTARIQTYIGCRDNTDVVFITLLEGGHDWPVIERNESDFLLTDDAVDLFTVLADANASEELAWDVFEVGLDASVTIWEFFSNH
jgi:polyhydroxybutyrate depolymerase